MKAIINDPAPIKPYPKLKISTSGLVVLFTDEEEGFVIGGSLLSVGDDYKMGEWRTDWVHENFHDFAGSVTLSN